MALISGGVQQDFTLWIVSTLPNETHNCTNSGAGCVSPSKSFSNLS